MADENDESAAQHVDDDAAGLGKRETHKKNCESRRQSFACSRTKDRTMPDSTKPETTIHVATGVEALVLTDLRARHWTSAETMRAIEEDVATRQQLGIRKYKVTVADNPLSLKQWLQHYYEELLDAAVYSRKAQSKLFERCPEAIRNNLNHFPMRAPYLAILEEIGRVKDVLLNFKEPTPTCEHSQ